MIGAQCCSVCFVYEPRGKCCEGACGIEHCAESVGEGVIYGVVSACATLSVLMEMVSWG